MSGHPAIAALLLLPAVACTKASNPVSPPETRAERNAALDRIAERCGVDRSVLTLVGDDELRLRPTPDTPYERVECVLGRLGEANVDSNQIGFVGNEAPSGVENDAQAR
jgi:hypothetical protein